MPNQAEESGIANFDVSSWFGVSLPLKTPPEIIAKLNADTAKVLALPSVRERFEKLGARIAATTPEGFGAYLRDEHAKWGKLITEAAIKLDS